MNDDLAELKRRLVEATRRFEQASSIEEKGLLGADVQDLERQVEIAKDGAAEQRRVLIPLPPR
jgi:hypothetical protein